MARGLKRRQPDAVGPSAERADDGEQQEQPPQEQQHDHRRHDAEQLDLKVLTGTTIPAAMLTAVLALVEENVAAYYGASWERAAKHDELAHPDTNLLLLCSGSARICAAATYRICHEESVHVAYLYELQVAEHARASGHGSRLMAEIVRIAREAGVAGVMLTVHARNLRARSFYASRRFEVSPISPSLCAPPALARTCNYEVMQLIWDAEGRRKLQRRGAIAKQRLYLDAMREGSLRIRLTMRSKAVRALDMSGL